LDPDERLSTHPARANPNHIVKRILYPSHLARAGFSEGEAPARSLEV